jgi:uncharacterized membrane protein YgaE (UPF0421/DUF939 family)
LEKKENKIKITFDLPKTILKKKNIDDDLKKALEELKKDNKDKAKPKKHLKDEREKMAESMAAGDMEQLEEDVAMLRQILDNLLAFSLSQKTYESV